MTKTILFVCISCKTKDFIDKQALFPGNQLYEKLKSQNISKSLDIVPIKCLAACSSGCSIALSANGKWSYIYGEMDPNIDSEEILLGAYKYENSKDGIVAWRERPNIFRKRGRARIPPVQLKETTNE